MYSIRRDAKSKTLEVELIKTNSITGVASGYLQIGLTEEAKEKSVFYTLGGLYQWEICLIHIDDIIIFNHVTQMGMIFTCLKAGGPKLKLKKFQHFKRKVQY